MRAKTMYAPLPERFAAKYKRNAQTGCWEWTASKRPNGYGQIQVDGRSRSAHRVAYELFVGPIPSPLVIDHVCGVRHCVNPDHLRACENRENVLADWSKSLPAENVRKTACVNGHPFDATNTGIRTNGNRYCRECNRLSMRRRRARGVAA